MRIKNISDKIISIGTLNLLPDGEGTVSDKVAKAPAVKAFIDRKYLELVKEATPKNSGKSNDKKNSEDSAPESKAE